MTDSDRRNILTAIRLPLLAALALLVGLAVLLTAGNAGAQAGPLQDFTLVDASDQAVLATLSNGGSVEVADPDGGSYAIRANVDSNASIGSVKLELTGAKAVTRTESVAPYSLYGDGGANALSGEALPAGSYTLTATAYSERGGGGDQLGTLQVSFTVARTNIAPSFGSSTYSFSIAEDAWMGTAVGSVSATDADNDGLTYTIESGNGDGKFAIDGSTGAITTAGALDYDTTSSYTLTVQADDSNGGAATAAVNVTLNSVPEFGARIYEFTIGDDAALGTPLGVVQATDSDGDGITYSIEGQRIFGPRWFYMDPATGVIYVLHVDHETKPYPRLSVKADDGNGGAGYAYVLITVIDLKGNSAPRFESTYEAAVDEDASVGAAVHTVVASDPDDDRLTFTILSGNEAGKFAIDGNGVITTAGVLDYETETDYELTVQIADGRGSTATDKFCISVRNVEEPPAGPLTGFTLVDASDQAVLATLSHGGSVVLADPDSGSYGIRADVDSNASIGSVKLELAGAKAVTRTEGVAPYSLYGDGGANALSGEALPSGSYTLTATAYSERGGGGDNLGTLEVFFTVRSSNTAPSFGSATYSFSIAEDASTGAALGRVSATDRDDDPRTYTIEAGNGDGVFAIDGRTGAITTAGVLDRETTSSYTLTVQADDGLGGTATATVNVTVTEVNSAPEFGATVYKYTIREDTSLGTTLGTVQATDSNGDQITYTVVGWKYVGTFYLNPATGLISVLHVDHETMPYPSLHVKADDGNGGIAYARVLITVTDAKGNSAPRFESSYHVGVAEDAAVGATVHTMVASDPDGDTLTFTMHSGNEDGKFAIDSATGVITTAGALDYDTETDYELTVQVADGRGSTDIAWINISVREVEEPTAGPLTGFTLVDASDQSTLATLTDGTSVALADPDGGSYGIRVDLAAGKTVGSVKLELSGAKTLTHTENIAPYSLFGDSNQGDESDLNGQALPAGSYTLQVTAYAEDNLAGAVMGILEISFTITQTE